MGSFAALYSTNVAALYAASGVPGGTPIGLLLGLTYASGAAPSTAGEAVGLLFLITKAS